MAAAVPDTNQLLELLKRAADELKVSQQETATARTDAETFARKLTRLETELIAEKERSKSLQSKLDEVGSTTLPTMRALTNRPPLLDERTNVSVGDSGMLEQRLKMLQDELSRADSERRTLKDTLRVSQDSLTVEREAAAAKLAQAEAQLQTLQAERADLEAGRAEVEQLITQNSKLEAELASAQAKFQAIEHNHVELEAAAATKHALLAEAGARISQLEQDSASLRTRRDALNVELAHVEQERNLLKARVTELEAAATARDADEAKVKAELEAAHRKALDEEGARRTELETQVAKEKERHQITAQRLLEARSRIRELEIELEKAVTNVGIAEAETAKVTQLQREALSAVGEQMNALQRKLDHASTEWVQVNRAYEQLHREMLTVLDQRDEARRELAALKPPAS